MHNGVLYNEHELYEKHKERFGVTYVSDNGVNFNDSEAYIYDLASYFSGKTDALEMTGYGAFILVEYDKETKERLKLHFGTTSPSSAPLHVHHTENHLDITSEGKGWLVEKDMHYVYDYKTGDITKSLMDFAPIESTQPRFSYYGYGWDDYDSYYGTTKGFGATKKTEEVPRYSWEEYDDVPLWNDDDYLAYPEEHKGWSMYMDGCCNWCDRRMEYFNDFSPLTKKTEKPHSLESVLVNHILSKQKVEA